MSSLTLKVLILCCITLTVQATFKIMLEDLLFVNNKLQNIENCQEPTQNTAVVGIEKILDIVRGPKKPPKKDTVQQPLFNQIDVEHFFESKAEYRHCDAYKGNVCYGSNAASQKAASTASALNLFVNHKSSAGDNCEKDNFHATSIVATVESVNKTDVNNASLFQDNTLSCNGIHGSKNPNAGCNFDLFHSKSVNARQLNADTSTEASFKPTPTSHAHVIGNSQAVIDSSLNPSYAVLVGNTVRAYSRELYASLPLQDKYMVKQRVQYASGVTRIKLVLKSGNESHVKATTKQSPPRTCTYDDDDDDVKTDGSTKKTHYRGNSKKPGYIVYTCDRSFKGDTKYPLPNGKATNSKIGKGGNGFVFIIYHGKRQYAVKQTVYRPNEVNVHSNLNHVNVLPLLAVLMGEKHANHAGRFHCYHFMPKMDYDFRQILSTKEVGCLKYLYRNCSANLAKFDKAFSIVKFILKETLKAISYIHSNGFVHRDIKASNIMIKMNCKCNPLYCECPSKFKVKLGDFDSAGTIPGLGIKEPSDQMIKFASILPLGTPGYRAPEVSMHIVLSGPYETLYTTAVDMWSFGCLCLNICIGKTAAVKQREEALLLLSNVDQCFEELWIKTTKIQQLEKTQPFANDIMLLHLIRSCLRIDYNKRLSATDALTYL